MAPALEAFRYARESTKQVLDLMTDDDWKRRHAFRERTVHDRRLAEDLCVLHAHNHAAQIRRLREAPNA